MTQKTIYICDNPSCCKEIGKKKHISLVLQTNHAGCGISNPPVKSGGWRVHGFNKNFIHFCSGQCAGRYFTDELKKDQSQ